MIDDRRRRDRPGSEWWVGERTLAEDGGLSLLDDERHSTHALLDSELDAEDVAEWWCQRMAAMDPCWLDGSEVRLILCLPGAVPRVWTATAEVSFHFEALASEVHS